MSLIVLSSILKIRYLIFMKILLLGAKGSLGRQFVRLFKKKKIKFYPLTRKEVNFLGNLNDLKNIINNYSPNFIINCIALTGIVYCQKKPNLAYKINAEIPFRILKIIKKKNIKFIHFSTEAVFEGKILKKIYSERDKALPTSVYGKSKLLADNKIIKQKNTFIIRLPLLFGPTHQDQIVSKLLKKINKNETVHISTDVYSTPVYTPDLCKFVLNNCIRSQKILKKKIIHFSSNSRLSIFEFISLLLNKMKKKHLYKIIPVEDSFFKNNIKAKPKNLGLKSVHKQFIKPINYNSFKLVELI